MAMDAVLDERTLREIYLTGFGIAVKEGGAKAIMPGVSTRAAIASNHSLVASPEARAARLEGNPVRGGLGGASGGVFGGARGARAGDLRAWARRDPRRGPDDWRSRRAGFCLLRAAVSLF